MEKETQEVLEWGITEAIQGDKPVYLNLPKVSVRITNEEIIRKHRESMSRPSLKVPSLMIVWVWIAVCIAGIIAFLIASTNRPVPESYESVREVREAIKSCLAMDDYDATIVTIWNAPVGQPRKPLRWEVTCQK